MKEFERSYPSLIRKATGRTDLLVVWFNVWYLNLGASGAARRVGYEWTQKPWPKTFAVVPPRE
jgi:hypothetical protein